MIRLIIQSHEFCGNTGLEHKALHTIDVELPELEAMMRRGGRGESGFESWQLIGAEVREEALAAWEKNHA